MNSHSVILLRPEVRFAARRAHARSIYGGLLVGCVHGERNGDRTNLTRQQGDRPDASPRFGSCRLTPPPTCVQFVRKPL